MRARVAIIIFPSYSTFLEGWWWLKNVIKTSRLFLLCERTKCTDHIARISLLPIVVAGFVQFIERDVYDTFPLLLDQCHRRLISLITQWRAVTQNAPTSAATGGAANIAVWAVKVSPVYGSLFIKTTRSRCGKTFLF